MSDSIRSSEGAAAEIQQLEEPELRCLSVAGWERKKRLERCWSEMVALPPWDATPGSWKGVVAESGSSVCRVPSAAQLEPPGGPHECPVQLPAGSWG